MNRTDVQDLSSQRNAIQALLERTPKQNVIDRLSLQRRLEAIDGELQQALSAGRDPVRAVITFRGRPVVESHGIFAEFGATAVKGFADAVAGLAAATTRVLKDTGPIPDRGHNQLLLTSTAVGSFGFALEEHEPDSVLFDGPSSVEDALIQAQTLFQATRGTDDDLADAVSETDPRAVIALGRFLETVADKEAICALQVGDRPFRFSDIDEVRRAADRLSEKNVREEDTDLEGEFLGVLPTRRNFEFRTLPGGDVIGGKVGPTIQDPMEINRILGRRMRIRVHVTRVGSGRPRYILARMSAGEGA